MIIIIIMIIIVAVPLSLFLPLLPLLYYPLKTRGRLLKLPEESLRSIGSQPHPRHLPSPYHLLIQTQRTSIPLPLLLLLPLLTLLHRPISLSSSPTPASPL